MVDNRSTCFDHLPSPSPCFMRITIIQNLHVFKLLRANKGNIKTIEFSQESLKQNNSRITPHNIHLLTINSNLPTYIIFNHIHTLFIDSSHRYYYLSADIP